MSSLQLDYYYTNTGSGNEDTVNIPNEALPQAIVAETRAYNARLMPKLKPRRRLNDDYFAFVACSQRYVTGCTVSAGERAAAGGGGTVRVYSCSTCPGACSRAGYGKSVGCSNSGKTCTCQRKTAAQKCYLSGSICKANNPSASSCSVRTYTNGSCVCDCKTASGKNLTPAAKPGTVAGVSKPVSSTGLKPGVIPKAGAPGSPEAEGTGRTGVTAANTNPAMTVNTKFGSFDVAALQRQPPNVFAAGAVAAGLGRQHNYLELLRTNEGIALMRAIQASDREAERIYRMPPGREKTQAFANFAKNEAATVRGKYQNWKNAFYYSGYAKDPQAGLGDDRVKDGISTGLGIGRKGGLGPLGPIAGPVLDVAGDVIYGARTGNMPTGNELMGNFTESVRKLPESFASPDIPVPNIAGALGEILNEKSIRETGCNVFAQCATIA